MNRSILGGFFIVCAAWAQQSPNGGGIAPSNTPNFNRTTTEQPIDTQNANLAHRIAYISGKVVLEDGSAPPDPAIIERVCGAIHRIEAHTDTRGRFSFQLGKNAQDTEQDVASGNTRLPGTLASASPIPSADTSGLAGCQLHASLPGYQSKAVDLSMHDGFDSPDIGIIVLERLAGREGNTISVTNVAAPKDAKKAFTKARQSIAKGELEEARKDLLKATELYPKYASAWLELGRLQMDSRELPAARASFQKALDADPKYLPPYERLSLIAFAERDWPTLARTTGRLIELNAYDYPQAYYYSALAYLNLHQPDAAEKSARQAIKLDPENAPRIGYVLGLALAQKGEIPAAAQLLKTYLASNIPANEAAKVRAQLAELERQQASRASK
ncbi:MAG TPA: tetratricopeptide repeat protein [Bryobacteraceae bacterium]|jgi:tetratricopeptide (TPR) repeat protein